MKKALNVNSLKSQQLTVNVRSLNVHALFLDTHSLKVSDSKKEIEEKDLIFVKVNAAQQQKTKSKFSSAITFNSKNKIIKKHLQHHAKLFFMKFIKKDSYQETCHIAESVIVKEKLMNIDMKNISFILSKIYHILKFFMQTLNALSVIAQNVTQLSACTELTKHIIN